MLCHREVRRLPHSPDRDVTSACASLDKKKRTATAGAKLVTGAKIDTDVYTYFSGHRRARARHFFHSFVESLRLQMLPRWDYIIKEFNTILRFRAEDVF